MTDSLRFQRQATFGPSIDQSNYIENYGIFGWLQNQIYTLSATLMRPTLEALGDPTPEDRQSRWWRMAVTAPDQLRQRVAFALSEILVISDTQDNVNYDVLGMAEYYDILIRGALGSFRELLENVSKSPAMGKYLSHLQNAKADPVLNTRPDENYAREVMQLFSIGLWELNMDGSRKLDQNNLPIPTYTQADIVDMAKVFTGWNYSGATDWVTYTPNYHPMVALSAYHDVTQKTILGTTFPANQTAQQDLTQAMDLLCNHANTAPFMSKQLIQRLVTSNPSPQYISDVANVWLFTQGNLGIVVGYLLTHPKARNPTPTTAYLYKYGKIKEPILALTHALRAIGCSSTDYNFPHPEYSLNQAPQRAPSVFNFFRPDFSPIGEIYNFGLVAPEAQIYDHNLAISITNYWYKLLWESYEPFVDFAFITQIASFGDDFLLNYLNIILMDYEMKSDMFNRIKSHLATISSPLEKAKNAIFLILSSPQYMTER